MMTKDGDEDREFEVAYAISETICSDEVACDGDQRPRPIAPRDVALFAVQRFLDGSGPEAIFVDVKDEHGVTHRFVVFEWDGELICEERQPEQERDTQRNQILATGSSEFDLTELSSNDLDGLSVDEQRDVVVAQARALQAWAEDLDRRGIW
jgi:hypothetical protein